MVVREMTVDLVCPEPCFQTATSAEGISMVKKWMSHPLWNKRAPLYAVIRSFRKKDMDPELQQYLAQSGVLNLWTIVSAFHVLLFHVDPGFGSDSQCQVLRNAICNWRSIWNMRLEDNFEDLCGIRNLLRAQSAPEANASWKRIGFMRNAPEYWLLARIILERLESTQQSLDAAESLSGQSGWRYNLTASVLPKYDETSMDQLNEFITSFQSLKMSE